MKKSKHPAWRMLLAACLLIAGGQGILSNTQGIFIASVCAEQGFGTGAFSGYVSVSSAAMMVAMVFAGKIVKKLPFRPLLIVCSVVACALFMSYALYSALWCWYVVGIIYAFAMAIPFYMAGPMLITNWFVKKQGLAMGIMMSMTGIFGAIFSIVGGIVIKSAGYHVAYVVLGASALVLELIGSFIAVAHPSMKGLKAYGAEETEDEAASETTDPAAESGVPAGTALKSPAFILCYISMFFLIFLACFAQMLPTFGVSLGYDITFSSSLASFYMIGTLIGSFAFGAFNDKIGAEKTTILALILLAFSAVGAVLTGKILIGLIACIIIMGFAGSSGGTQPAVLPSKLFGKKDYASIYGVVQTSAALSAMVAMPIYGLIYDITKSLSLGLFGAAAFCIVGVFCIIGAFKNASKLPWEPASEKISK